MFICLKCGEKQQAVSVDVGERIVVFIGMNRADVINALETGVSYHDVYEQPTGVRINEGTCLPVGASRVVSSYS